MKIFLVIFINSTINWQDLSVSIFHIEGYKETQKNIYEADFNRVFHSVQITIYIDRPGSNDKEHIRSLYKPLCEEIESLLEKEEKKINPADKPESDFKINKFLSIRYDKDKSGKLYVYPLNANRNDYKDNSIIQALADPNDLEKSIENKIIEYKEMNPDKTLPFDFIKTLHRMIDAFVKIINSRKEWMS